MTALRSFVLGLLFLHATVLQASGPMGEAVLRFVREHSAGVTGRVDIQIDASVAGSHRLACDAYVPFLPSGARLWGRTTVGVRCAGGSASVFVPVRLRVYGPAVVAARQIPPGQVLVAEDLRMEDTEFTQPGLLTDTAQALGQRIAVGVNPGFPIRRELLRAQPVISQGETVKVKLSGEGFTVVAEGTAITRATEGQSVQVRMDSGRTINGTARVGRMVEVRY